MPVLLTISFRKYRQRLSITKQVEKNDASYGKSTAAIEFPTDPNRGDPRVQFSNSVDNLNL